MDSVKLMIEEHMYIKRMLIVVRKVCFNVLNGDEIDYDDFEKIISFVKKYADAHHHGKEEVMLFNRMVDEIGGAAEKLVKFGMLVEHDLGRFYIRELGEALDKVKSGNEEAKIDVIANAVSYANLLKRHIDKEDAVVYPFAKRELNQDTFNKIDEECEKFEMKKSEKEVKEQYIKILQDLEIKYLA
ncbi:MAG: hemerythrin domain-containing protein [Clostridiaceae bacterium]